MLVAFYHGSEIPMPAGQDIRHCADFGFLFGAAPEMPFSEHTLDHLGALHRAMVETVAEPEGDHASQPPMFTYFGQFVDHDITGVHQSQALPTIADPLLSPVARPEVLKALSNLRTGFFDLDSLYGSGESTGNTAFDKLNSLMRSPSDKAMMRISFPHPVSFGDPIPLPADGAQDLLRLGELMGEGSFTQADLEALPDDVRRALATKEDDGAGTVHWVPKPAAVIIGDMRNDENLFIAQLHLAMLRFHNRMVQAYPDRRQAGDEERVFSWARGQVRLFYQWLVINEWLPKVCDPMVVASIRVNGPTLYNQFLAECDWQSGKPLPVPMEFATACFRFGHSMVRPAYDWNVNFGRPNELATFEQMFQFTGGGGMLGLPKLPSNWPADWDRLAYPPTEFLDRSTRKVDTKLASDLTTMVNETVGLADLTQDERRIRQNLLARNLRRGVLHNIPSAQSVAKGLAALGLSVPTLTPDEIASGATGQAVRDGGFHKHTPLWFYTLKEAELMGRGDHLGPLASHIVAGTIIGLVSRDPSSALNTPGSAQGRWHPVDGPRVSGQLVDSFPALLRAALLLPNPDFKG